MIGRVLRRKMQKTAIVAVSRRVESERFFKTVVRESKFKVHDEKNECQPGDQVLIAETRPLSRDKRWRLVKILKSGVGNLGEIVEEPIA